MTPTKYVSAAHGIDTEIMLAGWALVVNLNILFSPSSVTAFRKILRWRIGEREQTSKNNIK